MNAFVSIETVAPENTAKPTNTPSSKPVSMRGDMVWFGPNMGSRDYAELFTEPGNWSLTRSKVDVFKFHVQNVLDVPCDICGDNTLQKFVQAGAFDKLTEWGMPIAVDVGAVKEWGCSGDDGFRVAKEAVENIRNNGGEVAILVMDEPYLGGQLTANNITCGHTMEQSADATAHFINLVKAEYPNILVGLTEPYPYFSTDELTQWVEALEARGTPPAFFHLDVNMLEGGRRLENWRVTSDLQALDQFSRENGIPFGVIFTSNTKWNAKSNREYYDASMAWIRLVNDAIGKPQHAIFNSWIGTTSDGISNKPGVHEIPVNLSQNDPEEYSHVRLINDGLNIFDPAPIVPPASSNPEVLLLEFDDQAPMEDTCESVRQDMSPFGGDQWREADQLFGGGLNCSVRFELYVPQTGTYKVTLYATYAPDFAKLQVYIGSNNNNTGSVTNISLYDPVVRPTGRIDFGNKELSTDSTYFINFIVFGKAESSSDYRFGLDYLTWEFVK